MASAMTCDARRPYSSLRSRRTDQPAQQSQQTAPASRPGQQLPALVNTLHKQYSSFYKTYISMKALKLTVIYHY